MQSISNIRMVCGKLTKSDKLNKTEREKRLAAFKEELAFLPDEIKIIPFSAEKGEGVEQIRAIIEEIAE